MRKHKGINQQTGKLKKGYKYSGKKLKSGLAEIVKVKKSKRGGGLFDRFKSNSKVCINDKEYVTLEDIDDIEKEDLFKFDINGKIHCVLKETLQQIFKKNEKKGRNLQGDIIFYSLPFSFSVNITKETAVEIWKDRKKNKVFKLKKYPKADMYHL